MRKKKLIVSILAVSSSLFVWCSYYGVKTVLARDRGILMEDVEALSRKECQIYDSNKKPLCEKAETMKCGFSIGDNHIYCQDMKLMKKE